MVGIVLMRSLQEKDLYAFIICRFHNMRFCGMNRSFEQVTKKIERLQYARISPQRNEDCILGLNFEVLLNGLSCCSCMQAVNSGDHIYSTYSNASSQFHSPKLQNTFFVVHCFFFFCLFMCLCCCFWFCFPLSLGVSLKSSNQLDPCSVFVQEREEGECKEGILLCCSHGEHLLQSPNLQGQKLRASSHIKLTCLAVLLHQPSGNTFVYSYL